MAEEVVATAIAEPAVEVAQEPVKSDKQKMFEAIVSNHKPEAKKTAPPLDKEKYRAIMNANKNNAIFQCAQDNWDDNGYSPRSITMCYEILYGVTWVTAEDRAQLRLILDRLDARARPVVCPPPISTTTPTSRFGNEVASAVNEFVY